MGNVNSNYGSISRRRHKKLSTMECYDKLPKVIREHLMYADHNYSAVDAYLAIKTKQLGRKIAQPELVQMINDQDSNRAYNWITRDGYTDALGVRSKLLFYHQRRKDKIKEAGIYY